VKINEAGQETLKPVSYLFAQGLSMFLLYGRAEPGRKPLNSSGTVIAQLKT
jgi:hypothetical protein